MTSTLTLPASEVRSGDVIANPLRREVTAVIPRCGVRLLLTEGGGGVMVPDDHPVQLLCAEPDDV